MIDIIEKWGKYGDEIYQYIFYHDEEEKDWLSKAEYSIYKENFYFIDYKEYARIVKWSFKLKDKLSGNLYNELSLLQLSDNHTLWEIHPKKDIDGETYWMLVEHKCKEFEKITGVEVFTEGRSSRHICVENTLENAYRYDELCRVQERLEQELIDEINRGDF